MLVRNLDHNKLVTRRTAVLAGGKFVLLSALVGRLYYLQVIKADRYAMLADENRINLRLLAPARGQILDRRGEPLATNQTNYKAVLIAERTESVEAALDYLGRFIDIGEYDYARVLRESKRKRGYVPITVSEDLTWAEVARIEVNTPDLPGVMIDVGQRRNYPYGAAMAHVLGYVGPVAEDELTGDPLLEIPDFRVGKNGIEKVYDNELRGAAGTSEVEVNANGRVVRELSRKEGEKGADMTLTIDAGLQRYVNDRLRGEAASAAVLDIHTGDVMALGSVPSYDPAAFDRGLTREEWHELVNNPRKPLGNKAIGGQYPPGSTFKMIVALAALEAGVASRWTSNTCLGAIWFGDRTFHCWKRAGHGKVDMVGAIQHSCDIYFYEIARRVGINRIADMAHRFGMGQRLGVDLPGELSGLIPDRGWKLANFGVPWRQGETFISGIGQGYILTTPLQLAVMAARIANGGIAVLPRLVRGQVSEEPAGDGVAAPAQPPSVGVAPEFLRVVIEGMNRVTNNERGTAYRARIREPEMAMAGKTGTSQVRRISRSERRTGVLKNEDLPWEERDHALFVAFAPVRKPRYAISVVVEHGGSGSRVAAPIARDVLRETQRLDPARSGLPERGTG